MRRSVTDRVIAGANAGRFAVTEPVRLRLARARYGHLYGAPAGPDDLCPLISVCIPTYNRSALLVERSVPSVLAQTYRHFEIVVVGDHCTDDTELQLSRIRDSRIRFHNLPTRKRRYPPTVENHWLVGPAIAVNRAHALACGLWMARLDDDDTWTPDHLEVLLRAAIEGDFEFVSGKYEEERFGIRTVADGRHANDTYYTRRPRIHGDTSPKIGGVSTWLYRSYLRFLKYNVHCWRKNWNRVNDIDVSLRIYRAGVRMGFVDRVVSHVLPRPGEATVGFEAYRCTERQKLEHYKFT